ncbi:Hypothetical_protein [Hexamita inflata]|uniref:Hypothetical_protein n=1 Tax=Hexamita inflata TaxID=28002 RepID=A0AA86R8W8_9EUKA|nr:Hypothetical protein HINF_LOCUS56108 [Hexamita inflata]
MRAKSLGKQSSQIARTISPSYIRATYNFATNFQFKEFQNFAFKLNQQLQSNNKIIALTREMLQNTCTLSEFVYTQQDQVYDQTIIEVLEDCIEGAIQLARIDAKYRQ